MPVDVMPHGTLSLLDEEAGDGESRQRRKSEDAMCPGKSDGRKKLRDQEGPKDTTNGRARYGQPKSEGSSFIKPFSDCAGGRIVPLSAVSNTSFDP